MQGKKKRDAEIAEANRLAFVEGKDTGVEEPDLDDAPKDLLNDKDEDVIF